MGLAGNCPKRILDAKRKQIQLENNSTPVVVLVSSQHGGLGVIRSLGRAGIPIYGVHRDLWEPASRSRFLKRAFRWDFSSAPPEASVSFLRHVAKQIEKRPLLIPTSDVTALFVAENAAVLANEFLFATACAEVVRCFVSKRHTFDLCCKLHIPTVPPCRLSLAKTLLISDAPPGFPSS